MMKRIKFFAFAFVAISLMFVSCGETVDESQLLVDHLESAETTVDITGLNKLITAEALNGLVLTDKAYVIDIRSATDFADGHIDGAINLGAGDVIAHLADVNFDDYDKVVVACYTGQTAAFVVSLANIAGYETVSLKFGMSSWNAATDKWSGGVSNMYETQLETAANEKNAAGDLPVLTTEFETSGEILDAQVDAINAEGFGANAISAGDVFANTDDYYIVNYWPEENYNKGHVPGAIQYTPGTSMLSTEDLKTLPTDKTIVAYCYTGQGSAFLTAYLNVLGYDCLSLKFGINGMATDWAGENEITSWDSGKMVGDYELVTD